MSIFSSCVSSISFMLKNLWNLLAMHFPLSVSKIRPRHSLIVKVKGGDGNRPSDEKGAFFIICFSFMRRRKCALERKIVVDNCNIVFPRH